MTLPGQTNIFGFASSHLHLVQILYAILNWLSWPPTDSELLSAFFRSPWKLALPSRRILRFQELWGKRGVCHWLHLGMFKWKVGVRKSWHTLSDTYVCSILAFVSIPLVYMSFRLKIQVACRANSVACPSLSQGLEGSRMLPCPWRKYTFVRTFEFVLEHRSQVIFCPQSHSGGT